jgi:hypothetical protein
MPCASSVNGRSPYTAGASNGEMPRYMVWKLSAARRRSSAKYPDTAAYIFRWARTRSTDRRFPGVRNWPRWSKFRPTKRSSEVAYWTWPRARNSR